MNLNIEDIKSNEQIIQLARNNLEQGPWDYLVGGAESETTMRRNRLAFDKYFICVDFILI